MLTIKGKKGKLYFNSLSYTRTKSDLDPETAKLFGSDNSMTLPPRKAYKMVLFFLLAKIPIQAEKILKFSRAMFWLFCLSIMLKLNVVNVRMQQVNLQQVYTVLMQHRCFYLAFTALTNPGREQATGRGRMPSF